MKTFLEYLLSKNTKLSNYKFYSNITDNPKEFNGYNFIVDAGNWKPARVTLFVNIVKEILNEVLLSNEDKKFMENWLEKAKYVAKHSYIGSFGSNNMWKELNWLFSGEKFTFGNAKFTYDVIQYALKRSNLTIPQKQKFEKILKEFYKMVEEYKDEMNWY